jgi:hypothetical protein
MTIRFLRNKVVEVNPLSDGILAVCWQLTDDLLKAEVNLKIQPPDLEIVQAKALLDRLVPQAWPTAPEIIKKNRRCHGWERRIMKEIGRKGCEHFAAIIIECGRCLGQARMADDMWQALEKDPDVDQMEFMEKWLAELEDKR